MNNLKFLLTEHEKLAFPEFPQDEEFADWVTELIETDAYYVGIAMSYPNVKNNINFNFFNSLKIDFKKFSNLNEDENIYI